MFNGWDKLLSPNVLERNSLINLEPSLSNALNCGLCYVKVDSNALSIVFVSVSAIGLTRIAVVV